jgi:hypothetical protein
MKAMRVSYVLSVVVAIISIQIAMNAYNAKAKRYICVPRLITNIISYPVLMITRR